METVTQITGKKRKEISRNDMRHITEIYSDFKEGQYCKIFDNQEFMDFGKFTARLKEIVGDVDGMSASRLNGIAMEMSAVDKTAVVQKDKKGNVLTDSTTKDTEIIGLKIGVEEYCKREVYPHIPDALYSYEYDPDKKQGASNKEKLGAEFPFTRYFYEYKAPEKADDLLAQFAEIEKGLTSRVAALLGGTQ